MAEKKLASGKSKTASRKVVKLASREAVAKTGKSAVINIWVDPREYAPGTKAQTMYK